MADPFKELKAGLASARKTKEFSDCKIICGPHHFKAHKIILSMQSDYFKAAFKSGAFKEGESGIIEFKSIQNAGDESLECDDACDDPDIVKMMMEYFYHIDYKVDVWGPNMSNHAKVFAIAVKYQVNGLRDLAAIKFAKAVKECYNTAEFPQAAQIVHHSTPSDVLQLRTIVADTIHEHFDELKFQAEIETVISSIPGLAYDLLKRSRHLQSSRLCKNAAHKPAQVETLYCIQCNLTALVCKLCSKQSGGYGPDPFCPKCAEYARRI